MASLKALSLFALLTLGAAAEAACARPYVVLGSPGGLNLYIEDGRAAGFLPALAAEVSRRSGCVLTVEVVPPERLIAMADVGKADLLGNVSRGNSKPADRDFVDITVLEVEMVLDARSEIRSLDQFAATPGALLGRMRRGAETPALRQYFARIDPARIDVSEDADTLARKLAAGHIQAFFGTPLFYLGSVQLAGMGGRIRALPLGGEPYRIGWSMLHATVAAADRRLISQTIEAMRREGAVQRLLAAQLAGGDGRAQALPAAAR
ncbi:substrate-binding periplasmic protein [Niveibacterium umoris]|uniref:ABC-type amino acid transport substrate-binding protein n=1 Tax=Niveibacterium umoris TaxID=1193620 RepID=A0A840BKM2_9RHOO|nr:transporter substrate-binding domain-containing protein [Niveibacterium umoris]MBB4012172.1 ABC-type amino acid transport substrate-binding protein [Niveibacterium umoris]